MTRPAPPPPPPKLSELALMGSSLFAAPRPVPSLGFATRTRWTIYSAFAISRLPSFSSSSFLFPSWRTETFGGRECERVNRLREGEETRAVLWVPAEQSAPGSLRVGTGLFSAVGGSRGVAARVGRGGEPTLKEARPPAWISGASAAEKPEARRTTEAVAARPGDVRWALRPSRSRDIRRSSDWGMSGGHMFLLVHTRSPPPHSCFPPATLSPSPVSLGISTPPSIVNVPRPQSISYLSALVNLPVIYVSFCC